MSEQKTQVDPVQEEMKRREEMLHNLSPQGIIEALQKELKHSEENKKFFEDKIARINESLSKLS